MDISVFYSKIDHICMKEGYAIFTSISIITAIAKFYEFSNKNQKKSIICMHVLHFQPSKTFQFYVYIPLLRHAGRNFCDIV